MIWYVIENEQWTLTSGIHVIKSGWGNGYVAVPPSHCMHSIDYDRFYYLFEGTPNEIKIHGGITYSDFGNGINAPEDWWVFGFDTKHFDDNLENWPKERVLEETMNLFWQLLELEWGEL